MSTQNTFRAIRRAYRASLRNKHFPGQLILETGASLDGGGVFTINPRA